VKECCFARVYDAVRVQVIGLLLGTDHGNHVTMNDVCELIFTASSSSTNDANPHQHVEVNEMETNKIVTLRTAVYTTYSVLGWYAVSPSILPAYKSIHQAVSTMFKSNPLFLILSPEASLSTAKQLPIQVFNRFPNDGNIRTNLDFKLETSHLEKVAVDEVTKKSLAVRSSGIEMQNQAMMSSVKTLGEKIDQIVHTLKQMKSGAIPVHNEVMRRANKICRMLSTVNSEESERVLADQVDECLMITYLSTATKAAACVSELSDAYAMLYADRNLTNY
jgi:hypothetical protein